MNKMVQIIYVLSSLELGESDFVSFLAHFGTRVPYLVPYMVDDTWYLVPGTYQGYLVPAIPTTLMSFDRSGIFVPVRPLDLCHTSSLD